MRQIHQVLYGGFALLWIGSGIALLLALQGGEPSAEEVHLAREFGAGLVFVGLMHAWCILHYERRIAVHLALLAFAALLAAIHWNDWLVGARGLVSPLVNSIPMVVLAAMLLGGRRS